MRRLLKRGFFVKGESILAIDDETVEIELDEETVEKTDTCEMKLEASEAVDSALNNDCCEKVGDVPVDDAFKILLLLLERPLLFAREIDELVGRLLLSTEGRLR